MDVLSDLLKSGVTAFPRAPQSAELGSDVQLPTSNTFATGPSLSLVAGTWLILAHAQYQRTATTAAQVTARLRAGTTTLSTQNRYHASLSGITLGFSLMDIVTLGSTTTVSLQMATTAGSTTSLMKAAAPNNGDGNNATRIIAIRLD